MTDGSSTPGQLDITQAMTEELVTHQNVKQEIVLTTVDKLKLCLIEHKEMLHARREWVGPAGILVALVTSLVAAEFKQETWGLSAPMWEAIFLIAALSAALATILLIIRAVRSIRKGGVDELIDKIADRSHRGALMDPIYTSIVEQVRALLEEPMVSADDDSS